MLTEVLASERETLSEQIRAILSGIIQSFDPESLTAVVQPAIRYIKRSSDDSKSTKDYPLLVDALIVFPRGGGRTFILSVSEGDECLVIFANRCVDF